MKSILLLPVILTLAFAPILVTATDRGANTAQPENTKPIALYPFQPKNHESGTDNHNFDRNSKDEYPEPGGTIPETQPVDKSNFPPS